MTTIADAVIGDNLSNLRRAAQFSRPAAKSVTATRVKYRKSRLHVGGADDGPASGSAITIANVAERSFDEIVSATVASMATSTLHWYAVLVCLRWSVKVCHRDLRMRSYVEMCRAYNSFLLKNREFLGVNTFPGTPESL